MCTVDECDRVPVARSWCLMHYKRWRRYGDPTKTVRADSNDTIEQRLARTGWTETPGPLDTPCWVWSGRKSRGGYGQVDYRNKTHSAHRLAYEAWVGDIPLGSGHHGTSVRHKCDVRPCINPDHLETGSHKDNMRDMVRRGRTPTAKLTWEQVREIRLSSETHRRLSEKFGVAPSQIRVIQNNKTWVEDDPTPTKK